MLSIVSCLPKEKAENIDLSNLNERQSEIAEIGAQYDLSEDAIKSMVANDNEQISPRMYANEYAKMYLLGKQETIDSIDEAIRRNPEVRDTIQRIGTQAAGVAFSEANTPSVKTILRPETKPSGKVVQDFNPTSEDNVINKVLRRQAKASGIDIIVTDDMSKYTKQGNAQGVAFLDNGKVVLNKDVANILGTADHEILGHFGKALAPEAYKELASIIVDTYQKDLGIRGYDDFIQNLKSEAKEQGIYLTESTAQEEAIAYGLETMAMNTDAMEKFIDRLQDSTMTEAEKKTILDKLKEFVKHIINTLKERLKDARVRTGTESMLKADIDANKVAEAKLKVYEEIRSNLESMTEGEGAVSEKGKYSFAGVKSRTANTTLLREAQDLLEKGESKEDVFKKTGWFKGLDGKWRYEIDDSEFNLQGGKLNLGVTTLNELVNAEKLFKAYPQLKDTTITLAPNDSDAYGIFYGDDNAIALSKRFFKNDIALRAEQKIKNSSEYKDHLKRLEKIEADTKEEYDTALNKYITALKKNHFKINEQVQEVKDRYYEVSDKRSDLTQEEIDRWISSEKGKELSDIYNIDFDLNTINPENEDELTTTLIHEIQHAIQEIENFENGASPEWWKNIRQYYNAPYTPDENNWDNQLDKQQVAISRAIHNIINNDNIEIPDLDIENDIMTNNTQIEEKIEQNYMAINPGDIKIDEKRVLFKKKEKKEEDPLEKIMNRNIPRTLDRNCQFCNTPLGDDERICPLCGRIN